MNTVTCTNIEFAIKQLITKYNTIWFYKCSANLNKYFIRLIDQLHKLKVGSSFLRQ